MSYIGTEKDDRPMYDLNSGGMGHIAACVRSRAAASTADGRSVDNLRMPL